jgi:SAM-dependent methyltransferase
MKEQYKCQLASEQSSFVDCVFVVFSQAYLSNAIEKESERYFNPLRVLELGCYNARLANHLAQRKVNIEYTGIDVRQDYLDTSEMARKPNVTLMCCDATQGIPIESESMDMAVCSEVLEHLDAEDLPTVIGELHRLLIVGGIFIASFPMNTGSKVFHYTSSEEDLGHVNFPIHEDFINMCSDMGFFLQHFDSGFCIRSSYTVPYYISKTYQYRKIRDTLGKRVALAYAMTVDQEHTGGGYYTFMKRR